MKRAVKILLPIAIFGAVAYHFTPFLTKQFSRFEEIYVAPLFAPAPCTHPIQYVLATFNTQFGISKSYFLSALKDAEMIWEKPFGKELFTYKENSADNNILKINLVYDYRQQATSKLASLGIVVEDNRASYDSLKFKYTSLKSEYAQEKNSYDAEVQSFNTEQKAYEEQVQYWNAQGGAPKPEYEKLQAEKSSLDAKFSELQTLQAKINEMVAEINAFVVVLNRLVDSLNLSVEKYNTTNNARGESFEEGVYQSDGISKKIDIYEFSSRKKLVRVLAHELGHALDLEHVDDPKAIMYKLNQGNNETLTATDLAALKVKCGMKNSY